MERYLLEKIMHMSCVATSGCIIIGSIFWIEDLGVDMFVFAVILLMVSANALKRIRKLEWMEDELERISYGKATYKELYELWKGTANDVMRKTLHKNANIGSREIMHESADAEADTGEGKTAGVSCTEDGAMKVGDSTLYAYDIDEICNIIGKRIHAYPAFRETVKKIIQKDKTV